MDALVSAALQELAVEGPEGCTVTKLWTLLQPAAAELDIELAGRPKQFLWQELLEVTDIEFSLPNSGPIDASDPRLQTVESAELLAVQLVAPEALRDSSLGLYDLKVCDARLSKEQRSILERIAKSRTKGITQSQLAKEFKVAGNKIFYLVKMLEVRGLVVRQTTLVRTAEGKAAGTKVPIVATNLLHLTRFAKDVTLSSHQRFEIMNPSNENGLEAGGSIGDDAEGDEVGAATKASDIIIKDDFPAMEEICQRLEETEGKVLVVADLKGSLGYRKALGHRNWRRLMKRLQDAGVVDVFNAQIDRKVLPCLRLLKSFDVKSLSGGVEEVDTENGSKREKNSEMVMELSIDQQIYHLVSQSGTDGVQMMEVFNRLGLQNKRNYCRVATMLARQCLVSEAENHKRSTLYRLKTINNSYSAAQTQALVSAEGQKVKTLEIAASSPTSASGRDDALILHPKEAGTSLMKTVKEVKQQGKKTRRSRKKPESVQEGEGRAKNTQVLSLLNKDVLVSDRENKGSEAGLQGLEKTSLVPVVPIRTTQPHSGVQVSTTRAQREQRILEKLQVEKFVLRVELHRWLEDLEDRKGTMMDRKTLTRILQAFQRDGLCKCVLLSMPGLTNCGRQRTVEVVLLPSVIVDLDVLNKVHDRVRKFDMDSRGHGQSKVKGKDDVPILEGVKRMSTGMLRKKNGATKFDVPTDGSWSMQANGFIPAKMVRVSMLHHFLWNYVNNLPDESERLARSGMSEEIVGSCRIFALSSAIQTMPLELFLQIIGSIHKVDSAPQWCKQGLQLCELPKEAFSILLDTNATGRLSWLVDVLRRLKLVRLVMGCGSGAQGDEQDLRKSSLSAVLTYALEREPYLEEPAPSPLPSCNLDNYDTSPRARHEFSIATKDGLDAYWQTLEYFYSGAQPALARHAFPGSNVPELFGLRSWTSLRLMSTEQRTELLKRIGAGGIDKRKTAQECVQIAKDLKLTLEQVLRVSYEKNRIYRLQTLAKTGQISKKRAIVSGDFPEPSHVKAYKKQRQSELEVRVNETEVNTNKENSHAAAGEDGPAHEEEDDDEDEDDDDTEANREQPMNDFSFVANLKPSRQRSRRFIWSERLDRLLISAYVKQRARLGAVYPRVDWSTMEDLPAPPSACRRRMSQYRHDVAVRKAIMSLCSLIAARYLKHIELQRTRSGDSNHPAHVSDTVKRNQGTDGQLEGDNTENEYNWDDMSEPFLAAALDEILRCKNAARASASKRSGSSGTKKGRDPDSDAEPLVDGVAGQHDVHSSLHSIPDASHRAFATARAISSLSSGLPFSQAHLSRSMPIEGKDANPADDDSLTNSGGTNTGRFMVAPGPTRRIRKHFPKLLRKPSGVLELTTEQQVRKSVGVANAVEIVKLVLLNSINVKELVGTLVDAVQRFREVEVFTAVKYLREQGLLMAGQGTKTFVLSPKFFHDCSASRFPMGTGDQSLITRQWLDERSEKIGEDWVTLPSQQQAGQLSHLLSLVSSGEFTLNPSVPVNDIGEVEEKTTRRPASQRPSSLQGEDGRHMRLQHRISVSASWACERRERGFPGIDVCVTRSSRSLCDILSTYASGDSINHDLSPQSIFSDDDCQVSSLKVPDETQVIAPVDDIHCERASDCLGAGRDLFGQDSAIVLDTTIPDFDMSDDIGTRSKEVLDTSTTSRRAEPMNEIGSVSECTLHQTAEGDMMTSDEHATISEECKALNLVAADGSTTMSFIGNVLGQTLSTSPEVTTSVMESPEGQVSDHLTKNTETDCPDVAVIVDEDRESGGGPVTLVQSSSTSKLEKCVLYFSEQNEREVDSGTRLNPDLLRAAYSAIERAGEDGLTPETLQEDLQSSGLCNAGYSFNAAGYVQALEAFSLVKKVNAFDHVRILEFSQSKRFHLNILPRNKESKKRKSSGYTYIDDRQRKNFSSNTIGYPGGSDLSAGASRRRLDEASASAAEVSRVGEHRVISLRRSDDDFEDAESTVELVSIVPWLNGHGAVHPSMSKSLTRRVMGIVSLHPGIAEDALIEQLNVLNPQSTCQLLQLLEADGHLISRPVMQTKAEAPRFLQKLIKRIALTDAPRYMNHYFANPLSGGLL
ncbi:hypothetical protein AXG93_1712s1600 [Marchantia polymorpha subsp. ruderalis]|uniref:Uncharacterized protein n=1 Tax=Marchantia polymorpha subsp. ruderalis TaxID=1480154 RepID=A0A176VYX7_MARPO|nr:hypothetical protein AXG93_1712s1600 [Marchantia polymorpha subsp. ruderalis]